MTGDNLVAHDGGSDGGARINPYAGPEELRLKQVLDAKIEDLGNAITSWGEGAELLAGVADDLDKGGAEITAAYSDSQAGMLAGGVFSTVAKGVRKRVDEMNGVKAELAKAKTATVTAGGDFSALPAVRPPSTGDPTAGMPNTTKADKKARENAISAAASTDQQHESDYQAAEAAAKAALEKYFGSLKESESGIKKWIGLPDETPGTRSNNSGGSRPVGFKSPHNAGHEVIGANFTPSGGDSSGSDTGGTSTTGGASTGSGNATAYVPPGLQTTPTGAEGELAGSGASGSAPSVATVAGNSGSTGGATPGGSGTAAGVAAATLGGAGALGASAASAIRGGAGAAGGARAPIPGSTQGGRIGGSSSTARGGAIGRSPLAPGQSASGTARSGTASGRTSGTGAGGRTVPGSGSTAGGRTAGTGAAGRGAGAGGRTVPGAGSTAGGRTAGTGAGGRGAGAGARTPATGAGSTKAAGSSANSNSRNQTKATRAQTGSGQGSRGGFGAQGGRGNNGDKRKRERGSNDYDVDGGWLDGEEPTNGPVIK